MTDETIEPSLAESRSRKGMRPGSTTEDYRSALDGEGDFGSLGYEWSDKPHRLVYDLCAEIDFLHSRLPVDPTGGVTSPDYVEEAVAWLSYDDGLNRDVTLSKWARDQWIKYGRKVQPLFAAPPSPSPQSIEVGEMVERLTTRFKKPPFWPGRSVVEKDHEDAASLLIALDAERGRMRTELDEALDRVEHLEGAADQVSEEFDKECWKIVRRLLNDIGFDWQYADNEVTAEQAYEYISAALPIRDSKERK